MIEASIDNSVLGTLVLLFQGCLGYGYQNPRAPEDVLCTLISVLIGATWFALFIANVSSIVMSLDASQKKYDATLDRVSYLGV